MFCERCGLNFLPKQSVCTRCKVSATRHWFQLMSLVTLMVAVACNALVALVLLPRLTAGAHAPAVFRERAVHERTRTARVRERRRPLDVARTGLTLVS